MFCKQCGSELRDGAEFCTNCGNKISNNDNEAKNNKNEKSTSKNSILFFVIFAIAIGILTYKMMTCSVCGSFNLYKDGLCKEHYETKVATDIATDIYNKIFK